MGRNKTSGRYTTREELVREIRTMAQRDMPLPAIARRAEVSYTTAWKIINLPEDQ